jgi:hypothetical protein
MGTLDLWDVKTGKRRGGLALPTGQSGKKQPNAKASRLVQECVFAPDGRCLALEFDDNTVTIFELASGQARSVYGKEVSIQERPVDRKFSGSRSRGGGTAVVPQNGPRLAFSGDGKSLVHAGQDQVVYLWDVATSQELAAFRGHTGLLTAVAFAPDGKSVASASWDTTALVWDVSQLRPTTIGKKLAPEELANHWDRLAVDDAASAFNAIVALAGSPHEAVSFLGERLKPVPPVEPKRIEDLVAQLDSAEFKRREEASSELLKIGEQALPALEKALAGNPPLEFRRRLDVLRNLFDPTSMRLKGDRLRVYRAVEVLERIGTPDARRLLTTLAAGAPGALLATSAEAALKR